MYRMFRLKVFVYLVPLFLSLFFFINCSTPEPTGACESSRDCSKGERCIRQKCKKFVIPNEPPIAHITKIETRVRLNSTVNLDGSKSKDADQDKLTYKWSFASKPSDSQASFKGDDQVKTSFVVDKEGDYIIQLVVKDKKDESRPARAKIQVYGKDENGKPSANAGPDQLVGLGKKVSLDGTGSSDPDGDKVTYKWEISSKPQGSQAKLSTPSLKNPTFTADKEGKYIVSLITNDGLEDSDKDTASIEALADFDLQPTLTKITPSEGISGTTVTVKIEGKGFSKTANVIFNGKAAQKVKYTSTTELEAELSLAGVGAGNYKVKIRNPNTKESKELDFKVKPEEPIKLISLSPAALPRGAQVDVTATGSGFLKGAVIYLEKTQLNTTYKSTTELSFKIDLRQTVSGNYKVYVKNPTGKASNLLDFKVLEPGPAPQLRVLNPPAGTTKKKVTFSAHGIGFSPGAQIMFDGQAVPSKRFSRDEVQANPTLDLTNKAPGKYQVWVRNADGQISNKKTFEVEELDPTPKIDRILPFFIYLGGSNQLTIYGRFFKKGSTLLLAGQKFTKKEGLLYRGPSALQINIDTTKGTWKAGDTYAQIESPGGKRSNTFKLTVAYRVPTISSVTPNGWTTKCNTNVELFGTNFTKSSKVLFVGSGVNYAYTTTSTTHKLTYVNDRKLKFELKATSIRATTYNISVDNGPSSKSGIQKFSVQSGSSVPKPIIASTQPSAGQADTKVTISLNYKYPGYFRNGAIVYLNGKIQKTTCARTSGSNCYQLGAELDLTGLKAGSYKLQVYNPCGVKSDVFAFLVTEPPTPYIAQLSPSYAEMGAKVNIAIKGVNFTKKSLIMFGKQALPTTFVSENLIRTTKPLDLTKAKVGTVDVLVDNKNGKKTKPVRFTIIPKKYTPVISSLSTVSYDRGKIYNNIIMTGKGFTNKTEVYFNSKKLPTVKYVAPTQLHIGGLDFNGLKSGTFYVYAKEGTQQSNWYPVLAKPLPAPIITRINPTVIYQGSTVSNFYIYASRFCKVQSRYKCVTNPKVVIIGPAKKDFSSNFRITYTYLYGTRQYLRGPLNTALMAPGAYKVYLELPTGERSNPDLLQVKPIPDPKITELSPSYAFAGQTSSIRISSLFFCPLSSNRCTSGNNPIVHFFDSAKKDYASSFRVTYTYQSSSTYGYLRGSLDTSKMKIGVYNIQIEHPVTKKKSNLAPFIVRASPDPYIKYTNPRQFKMGSVLTASLYGGYFAKGAFVKFGLKSLPASGSSSKLSFVLDTRKMKAGLYPLYVQNPNGQKSAIFYLTVVGSTSTPIITSFYGSSKPLHSNGSFTLYVYGLNWNQKNRKPTITLNGKKISGSQYCYLNTRYDYCRFYSFKTTGLKAGVKYTVTYASGLLKSAPFYVYLNKAPSPEIRSLSPRVITLSTSGTISTRVRVSGSNFQTGAYMKIGSKVLPASYSSASSIYFNLKHSTFKKGSHQVLVVNPDKTQTNPAILTLK